MTVSIGSDESRYDRARENIGTVDEVMERYGQHRERDGFYCCPFHEERSGSFHTVKGSEYFFKCFGCDVSGDVINLEAHFSGRSVGDVLEEVAPAGREVIMNEEPQTASDYMKLRGITDVGLLNRAHVTLDEDRVWFPWLDYDGREVYTSGRAIDDRKPKYKNSQGLRPPMYPTPGAWQAESVVLVEGQVDALAAEQAGHPAFATGTSTLLEDGVPILATKKRVILVADQDPAGERWRDEVLDKLRGRVELWEAKLPKTAKDLAEVAQAAVENGTDPVFAVAKVLDNASIIRSRFALWTLGQLASVPTPDELIHDVLTARSFAVIYGASGVGKTFVTLDMALSIATGSEWMGFTVKQGPVVYVAAEGMFGIGKRVEAWKELHHISDVEHFYVVPTAINLLTDEVDEFAAELEQMPEPPAMVIFDTFARSMVGGDENSAKDVGRAIAALDTLREATGATVVVVHHTAKHATQERGSSSLRGAADCMIKVRMDEHVIITHDKSKESEPFFPLHAKMITKGESCALQQTFAF